MPALTSQTSYALQLEAVNEYIPFIGEQEEGITALFKDMGSAKRVSTHAFRVRLKTSVPSQFAMGSLDSGAFPVGSGSTWDQGLVTPKVAIMPLLFSHLADVTGTGSEISTSNPVTDSITDLVAQAKRWRDVMFQQGGNGQLATIDSTYAPGANPIVLASASTSPNQAGNGFGGRLLPERGITVQIMSPTYVLRGTATVTNNQKDLGAPQQITVDNVPAGSQAGDLIMVQGVAQGVPVSFSGLPYYHNTTTQGNCMGIARQNSYVVSNGMNLFGAQVSLPIFHLAANKVRQTLGNKGLKNQVWQTHLSQLQAYGEIGTNIQQNVLSDGRASNFDGVIDDNEKFTIAGRKIFASIHADQTRWDLINLECWGRVTWGTPPYWYKLRTGEWIFPLNDPATSQTTPQQQAYLIDAYEYFNSNAKSGVAIIAAKVPALN